jgi:hypothetical protein
MNDNMFLPYLQIINNIKYTQIINTDMTKIKIKNLSVDMTKVNITLVNQVENNHIENIVHHKSIQQYIDSLNKYIVKDLINIIIGYTDQQFEYDVKMKHENSYPIHYLT